MISGVWESVFGFVISALGVGVTLMYARRAGVLDVPNHRSSHAISKPRGGGIALIASVFVVALFELGDFGLIGSWVTLSIAATVAALTLVGWLDDHGSRSVAYRMPVHLVAGISVAVLVNAIAPMPSWLNVVWLIWWMFWSVASINIVNFMDGIDGMIALQGLVYGIFLFALLPPSLFGARFGLILASGCLGFLLWNWAPSKIFMGDVGSGPLGLFFVIGGALALQGAPATLVFLPLFPLYLDALVTLAARWRRGEKITVAHRSHLYQRMANGGFGHALVTCLYALAAAAGAMTAVTVNGAPSSTVTTAIVAYCVAVILIGAYFNRRFPLGESDTALPAAA
jgi:UDP-N-acetylmuramyl pentapeptide phosphotransferase/UDP-N-acetylglucosamine-1-phosphate transferase